MGLLSNLLLPGRLRTGPTVVLPAKTKPEAILEIVRLADPQAELDGNDVLAAATRIHDGVELTPDLQKKLGLDGEEKLWAHRVVAERPLPVDYYDKLLAAGLAYRLGGYCLCEGSADDPAEDVELEYVVYLPAVEESELTPALEKILGTEEDAAEGASPGVDDPTASSTETEANETADGHPDGDATTGDRAGSAPGSAASEAVEDQTDSGTEGASDAATEAGDESDDAESASDDVAPGSQDESDDTPEAPKARTSRWSSDGVYEAAGFRVSVTPVHRFPAAVAGLMPYATEVVRIAVSATEELDGDARMLDPGNVALALGTALDGPVVDHWGFQVFEPADLLPPRSV
ncbi:hypothetical protein FDA94_04025 [Herbidospora galbida]|uniref:Uncharacterized protein n=1 Tax=Herbidospora galbida TaxID=2575442 RepID=A0A4U3MQ73_9ACTN|nr:hypothetical protein [Herbidospora galbida]TKK90932.1 hypothetical protein FDA94_04025 [Herbidospora galbida]